MNTIQKSVYFAQTFLKKNGFPIGEMLEDELFPGAVPLGDFPFAVA
jgi:hypothetical protein